MKTVLITGAGRGIGLALTKEFLKNGDRVLATYRSPKSAAELLNIKSENLTTVTADVVDEKSFGPLKEAIKKAGKLDIVINNSGVIGQPGTSFLEYDLKKVEETLNVNTLGPMRISQLAAPFLNKGSVLAHVSSLMGSISDNSSGGYYDYRMSKTALNMFNKCLSMDLKDTICLVLHPGWVQTDMGGAGATVPVEKSAHGLFKVVTTATPKQSGHFIEFTGKELPW